MQLCRNMAGKPQKVNVQHGLGRIGKNLSFVLEEQGKTLFYSNNNGIILFEEHFRVEADAAHIGKRALRERNISFKRTIHPPYQGRPVRCIHRLVYHRSRSAERYSCPSTPASPVLHPDRPIPVFPRSQDPAWPAGFLLQSKTNSKPLCTS